MIGLGFEQAVVLLKTGARVRRRAWPETASIALRECKIQVEDEAFVPMGMTLHWMYVGNNGLSEFDTAFSINGNDIAATDWEVYTRPRRNHPLRVYDG